MEEIKFPDIWENIINLENYQVNKRLGQVRRTARIITDKNNVKISLKEKYR